MDIIDYTTLKRDVEEYTGEKVTIQELKVRGRADGVTEYLAVEGETFSEEYLGPRVFGAFVVWLRAKGLLG